MPIVFVHGVANRKPEYDATFASLERYLRRYVAPAVSDDAEGVAIIDAYWGDLGASFAWDRVSRPPTPLLGMGAESLPDEVLLQTYAQLRDQLEPIPTVEDTAVATGGLIGAGAGDASVRLGDLSPDELSDVAAAVILSTAGPQDDVVAALIAADELAHDPDFRTELAGLDGQAQHARFTEEVAERVAADAGLLGQGVGWMDRLKDRFGEVFDRARRAPGWAASRALLEARRPLHNLTTVFLGDIFTYLDEARSQDGDAGPIAGHVLGRLREAQQASDQRGGEPLVVLSHSMGGQIVYDLVSSHLPGSTGADGDIHITLWCAAASQVGLFEELKLFEASSDEFSRARGNKVPFPGSNLTAWWNVWDSNDVLSFTAAEIFEGVDDEEYSSGLSVISAHSGYFVRPTFFRRLADKVAAAIAAQG